MAGLQPLRDSDRLIPEGTVDAMSFTLKDEVGDRLLLVVCILGPREYGDTLVTMQRCYHLLLGTTRGNLRHRGEQGDGSGPCTRRTVD